MSSSARSKNLNDEGLQALFYLAALHEETNTKSSAKGIFCFDE